MEGMVRTSREDRRRQWQGYIEGQKQSGMTVTAYCAANGLRLSQFWYWRHVLCSEAAGRSGFVELEGKPSGYAGVTLVVRGITIQVGQGFSPSLLRQVIACLAAP